MFRPIDGICTTSRRIATDMAQVEERNRAMMHAVTGRDQVFCRLRTEGHASARKRGAAKTLTSKQPKRRPTAQSVCLSDRMSVVWHIPRQIWKPTIKEYFDAFLHDNELQIFHFAPRERAKLYVSGRRGLHSCRNMYSNSLRRAAHRRSR